MPMNANNENDFLIYITLKHTYTWLSLASLLLLVGTHMYMQIIVDRYLIK